MARRRKHKLPTEPFPASIESLAHDGRGVAHIDGKAVFIDGALPGEAVTFLYTAKRKSHDEGKVHEVISASDQRVPPRCPHAGVCGGCSLQHLDAAQQIQAKQQVLLDNLERIGKVRADTILPPLTGPHWGYRHKARLGAKHVFKKGKVLVGFREKHAPYVADLSRCEVLHPAVGGRIEALAALIQSLSISAAVPQVEVAVGDDTRVLIFRVLEEPGPADRERLADFARRHDLHIYLQPKGPDSVSLLWPDASVLSYTLPEYALELQFLPNDFTQVNPVINRKMIPQALKLLELSGDETVLDLFCGLGNFTLPIAKATGRVVGVEGDAGLVQRARDNAVRNGIDNVSFHVCDLTGDVGAESWLRAKYDKVLIDPPRSGAQELMALLGKWSPERIVYVSCHPGSLARDAGLLVHEQGYRLVAAGVMDMFPHTSHVESMALFVKAGQSIR